MQGANSWYGQSLYLLLRGKQCQLRMFQAGSKEQIIRFHSSVLFTELLQKCIYDIPRVFFSRMCSVVLRAPDASIYLHFLSSGRKVEISMRLRSVKMNYRIIWVVIVQGFVCWFEYCSLFLCSSVFSMTHSTSFLPLLPSLLVLHTKTYTENRCFFPRIF